MVQGEGERERGGTPCQVLDPTADTDGAKKAGNAADKTRNLHRIIQGCVRPGNVVPHSSLALILRFYSRHARNKIFRDDSITETNVAFLVL